MNKIQQKRVISKKAARDRRILAKARREEVPVSPEIRRAAKRAGIDVDKSHNDSTRVTCMRGDVELAVSEVSTAFEEIFEAEVFTTDAEHDHLVMCALRRLRNVQNLLGVELQRTGGAL
jgi:hypothetical protein